MNTTSTLAAPSVSTETALPWDALLMHHDATVAEANVFGKAYSAAEEALMAIKKKLPRIDRPPELTIKQRSWITMVIDGKTIKVPGADRVMESEDDIRSYFAGDEGAIATRLSALAAYNDLLDQSQRASGYVAAEEAEEAAYARWLDAQNVQREARDAILAFPTADPAKVALKRALLKQHPCDDLTEEFGMIIDAMMQDIAA